MDKLISFFYKFKDYLTFLILNILCLFLIYNSDSIYLGGFRSLIVNYLGWTQESFSFINNPIILKSENRALRDLNLFLSNEITNARVVQLENEKLRELLNFREKETKDYISAEVVGKSNVSLRSFFILDKGIEDSVKFGMSCRTDAGLVGVINFVSSNYSILEIIRNKHISIAIKIQRNAINGILVWSGVDNVFEIKNIPVSYDVKVNDIIITSDFSNKYPNEIPVGKIIKVENINGSLFYTIKVKPFVDFYNLEQLFIDKKLPNVEKNNIILDLIDRINKINK